MLTGPHSGCLDCACCCQALKGTPLLQQGYAHHQHCIAMLCHRGDNVVAIDLITEHIRMKLQQPDLRRIYPNLEASGDCCLAGRRLRGACL